LTSAPLLQVDDIHAVYGEAILALHGVSLAVEERSIVPLLGTNGSGKTTTLKAISNLLASERGSLRHGRILWRGEPTARLDPADLVRKGVVQVLEGRHVFPRLTVEENLMTGAFLHRPNRKSTTADLDRIYAWFPRLRDRRSSQAGLTSGGEQQMIAIGRALMTRPTLVLLDEPSMGLAPIIVQEIFGIIRKLNREDGVSFLLAEQNAALVLEYADHAYVLQNGRVVEAGTAASLAESGRLGTIYMGLGQAAVPGADLHNHAI
jgi:branched-chain amino acid transport system ATP-binding protein